MVAGDPGDMASADVFRPDVGVDRRALKEHTGERMRAGRKNYKSIRGMISCNGKPTMKEVAMADSLESLSPFLPEQGLRPLTPGAYI